VNQPLRPDRPALSVGCARDGFAVPDASTSATPPLPGRPEVVEVPVGAVAEVVGPEAPSTSRSPHDASPHGEPEASAGHGSAPHGPSCAGAGSQELAQGSSSAGAGVQGVAPQGPSVAGVVSHGFAPQGPSATGTESQGFAPQGPSVAPWETPPVAHELASGRERRANAKARIRTLPPAEIVVVTAELPLAGIASVWP